jgi:hypothetical protein
MVCARSASLAMGRRCTRDVESLLISEPAVTADEARPLAFSVRSLPLYGAPRLV